MNNRNNQVMESNDQNKKCSDKQKGISLKHGILMLLCCLIPIILIGILPIIGVEINSWRWLIFILCPLMHLGMMFFMKDHH